MTTCFLAPDPLQSTQFIPGGNTVANGGQLFFYAAGSSTKQTVYKDNAAAVAWTNPIVLDSGGNLPSGGEVWFTSGQTYKVIFAPSTDTDPPASPYWTKDNLAGVNDVSAQLGAEWVAGPSPTFISGTQFVLAGDQTGTFTAGRRVKTTNTGGTVYSVITQVTFGSSSTTVNVVSDSGTLDSGLNAVSYGVLDPANPSASPYEINRKGANIASSGNGTTNIWASVGDYVHVTGTNNIFSFSTAPYAGAMRHLVFDGVLTIVSSSVIGIPGSVNVTTETNGRAIVRAETVSTHTLIQYIHGGVTPNAGGIFTTTQVFTSTGTWTPRPALQRIEVTCIGGGGAGGGSASTAAGQVSVGGGGGGGGWAIKTIDASTAGTSQAITVGSGGGASAGAAGSNGSTTSFGALLSAPGGNGGSTLVAAVGGQVAGGSGGVANSGDVFGTGADGGYGAATSSAAVNSWSGSGGNTLMATVRQGIAFTGGSGVANGVAGKNFGGGGSGASAGTGQTAGTGGAGASGVVIIKEYY